MPALKKKYKLKWKNLIKVLIFLGLSYALISGGIHLFNHLFEYKKTTNILNEIRKNTTIEYVVDNESTIIIDSEDAKDKFSPYFIYIKQGMINLSFNKLKKKYPDITAWIQIKNSKINTPIVYSSDTTFYKTHTYDKNKNRFGAIYTPNNLEDESRVTLIKGNKAIFDLRFLYDEKWKDDNANYLIKFVTPEYTSLWQMVSVYKDKKEIKTEFTTDEEYTKLLNELIEKSDIDFKTSLNTNDRLLILESTDNIKLVGKLIKIAYIN